MKLEIINMYSYNTNIVKNNSFKYIRPIIEDTIENKKKYGIPTLPIIYDLEKVVEDVEVVNNTTNFLENKLVSLTFDDGPTKYTNELLKVLERNHSRATFFILGNKIRGNEEAIKNIRSKGNEIGINGYSHKPFTNMSLEDVDAEIDNTLDMLKNLGVKPSNIVRPPYGKLNGSIKIRSKSPFVLWNIDTSDVRDKEAIRNKIISNIQPGSIIKLHDTSIDTIEALEEVLPELIKDGYRFVTVGEMNKIYENDLVPGKVYGKVYDKLKEVA
nr:polysaccharide deacetylase family protein [Bacilli bacterium]